MKITDGNGAGGRCRLPSSYFKRCQDPLRHVRPASYAQRPSAKYMQICSILHLCATTYSFDHIMTRPTSETALTTDHIMTRPSSETALATDQTSETPRYCIWRACWFSACCVYMNSMCFLSNSTVDLHSAVNNLKYCAAIAMYCAHFSQRI